MNKLEPWAQELADKILHDLPEELAIGALFSMHEGGDALVVSYPASWTGQPEFLTLDRIVRGYGAAFVSRGKGKSFYMVPRPKPQPSVTQAPKDANPTAAEAPKPTPAAATSPISQPEQNTSSQAPVKRSESQTSKQHSPLQLFTRDHCGSCADNGKCDVTTDNGRFYFAACLQIQELQQRNAIVSALQKLADRPVYSRSGSSPRKDPPRERHVDGGVSWFWNDAHTYEKALDSENKDSKEFVALKMMLTDAATAGKKGLVVGAYWCFLDSFKKDGVLRKKAQDFSQKETTGK